MRKLSAWVLAVVLMLAMAVPAMAAGPALAVRPEGVVTDELGRPVKGAEVEVYKLGDGLSTVLRVAADGRFQLAAPAEPGTLWFLRATAPGYRTVETGWVELYRSRYQSLQMESLFGTLQVLVADPDGEPVTARVVLASGGQQARAFTASDGTLPGQELLPGSYQVTATAHGHAPAVRTVTVKVGSTATALIVLEPSGSTLYGTVRDGTSRDAVAGAVVELLRDGQVLAGRTRSDLSGHFALPLPEGSLAGYRLRTTADGYQPAVAGTVDPAGAEVVLQRATGVLTGQVVMTHGAPAEDVPVMIELKGYGQIAETRTDSKGTFRVEGLPAGADPAVRAVVLEQYMVLVGDWVKISGGGITEVALQDQSPTEHSYVSRQVTGVIMDAAGQPVSGAKVELFNRTGHTYKAVSGTDGSFTLESVASSQLYTRTSTPYVARVTRDGYITTTQITVSGAPVTEFHVPDRGPVALRASLQPVTTTAEGRIADSRGKPVAGAKVRLAGSGYAAEAVTSGGGWYQFTGVPAMPGVRFTLSAEAGGFLPASGVEVAAGGGDLAVPPLSLRRAEKSLTGLMTGADGTPLEGVSLELVGPDGRTLARTDSDPSGRYQMAVPALQPGPLVLLAVKTGWEAAGVSLQALATGDGATVQDLTLRPESSALTGRVLRADGRPAAGIRVELMEEGRGHVTTAVTAADGSYRFPEIRLDGTGWFWLRIEPLSGTQGGSLRHGTDMVPLMRLPAGHESVLDLLLK